MSARIVPFAFAGAVGFIVDAIVLLALRPVLGPFGGRLLSVAGALLATWAINRRLAFADRATKTDKAREFVRYALAMLPGATVNWLCYALVVTLSPPGPATLILALVAGSLAGLGTNFSAATWFVFRVPR